MKCHMNKQKIYKIKYIKNMKNAKNNLKNSQKNNKCSINMIKKKKIMNNI